MKEMKLDQAFICFKPHMLMTLCLFHANNYVVQDEFSSILID